MTYIIFQALFYFINIIKGSLDLLIDNLITVRTRFLYIIIIANTFIISWILSIQLST